jgi:hypothetical protein
VPAAIVVVVVVVVVVAAEAEAELTNRLQQPRGVVGDTELVDVVGDMDGGPPMLLVDDDELEARCVCPFD